MGAAEQSRGPGLRSRRACRDRDDGCDQLIENTVYRGALRVYGGALAVTLVAAAAAALVHPIVGLVVAVALLAAPRFLASVELAFLALVAVIALLPFAAVPLGIGFNPTFLDFALVLLYGIWAIRLATRVDSLTPLPPLALGVLAFMAIALAAFVLGTGHDMPSKNQIRVFGELIAAAGLYFVVWSLMKDAAHVATAFRALAVVGVIAAAVGLVLYVLPDSFEMRALSMLRVIDYPSGRSVLRFINDDPSRLQRATGTSVDPNSFGGLLAVIAALLVPQALSKQPLVSRRAAIGGLIVVLAALLATVSRGSLIAFGAGLAVIAVARDRRLAVIGGGLVLLLVVVGRFVPWTASYLAHFSAGLAGDDLATRMRVGEYRDALRLIERYPWTGVGFGGARDIDLYRGVSSLYLIIAETLGLVGLTAFLILMAAFLGRLWSGWRALGTGPSAFRALALGTLAALVAALVGGLFDHYFFTYPHAFALLWLILGLGVSGIRIGQAETLKKTPGGQI